MKVYYNEIDEYCQIWLKNLMNLGVIPEGYIDGRSIEDVTPSELMEYDQCHFFAGIGVWAYATRNTKLNGKVWTGSCPCQPFSTAGQGKGFDDERHLWPAFEWLISQCLPDTVFGEQVSGRKGLDWFSLVQSDMEAKGYITSGLCLPAGGFGAPHKRDRLFWVATNIAYPKWNKQPRKEPCSRQIGRMGGIKQSSAWNIPWKDALCKFRDLDDGTSYGVRASDAIRNTIAAPVAENFVKVFESVMQED